MESAVFKPMDNAKQINNGANLLVFQLILNSVSFIAAYVLSSYFQRGRFDQLFLNDAIDIPPVPESFYPGPLGVHTFSDFLQPLWQSHLSPSPYIGKNSSYPPGANGVFWLLNKFPYWQAFCIFAVTSLLAFTYPFWRTFKNLESPNPIIHVLGGLWLTFPVLVALDRGNIQLLTSGLIILAFYFEKRKNSVLAGFFLGAAISLKVYPLLFILIFLRKKAWRSSAYTVLAAGFMTVVPLLLFRGGLKLNVRSLTHNLSTSQDDLSSLALFANNSLKALSLSLRSAGLNQLGNFLNVHLLIISVVLILVIFCGTLMKACNDLELSLLIAASITLLIVFSPGYVLLIFFVPIFFIYHDSSNLPRKWVIFYSGIIALIIMPKQLPMKFWKDTYLQRGPSIGSLINPLIMLILIFTILARISCSTRFKTKHRHNADALT